LFSAVEELLTSGLLTKVSGLVVERVIFKGLLGGQFPLVTRPSCLAVLVHTAEPRERMHTRRFGGHELGFLRWMQDGDTPSLDGHPAVTSVYTHEGRASL
jgi:hypothetical protein